MDTLRHRYCYRPLGGRGPFTVATFIRSPDEKITAKKSARHTADLDPPSRAAAHGSQRSVTPALADRFQQLFRADRLGQRGIRAQHRATAQVTPPNAPKPR